MLKELQARGARLDGTEVDERDISGLWETWSPEQEIDDLLVQEPVVEPVAVAAAALAPAGDLPMVDAELKTEAQRRIMGWLASHAPAGVLIGKLAADLAVPVPITYQVLVQLAGKQLVEIDKGQGRGKWMTRPLARVA